MSDVYLLDTNMLLRYVEREHPLHQVAYDAINALQQKGDQFFIFSQNCIEFWNVTTRPIDRNGFGKTTTQADAALLRIEQLFPVLPDIPAIYLRWRQLVVQYKVSGVQVHDARIVAAMLTHGIPSILTFNANDFARYAPTGIVAVNPHSLIA